MAGFYCKFTADHVSGRVLKISQYLMKLLNLLAYCYGPSGIFGVSKSFDSMGPRCR